MECDQTLGSFYFNNGVLQMIPMIKVAILIDGGFYRKRATKLFGTKNAKDRAKELEEYCHLHLKQKHVETYLYRIFYYDCPPCDKNIFHPFLNRSINLKKQDIYEWTTRFFAELKSKRKFALRLGRLSDNDAGYVLKPEISKALFSGKKSIEDISESDFMLNIKQKTMDMKLGTDIASMVLKKQVDQIILIAGDSDFVPAAKLARREGVDFILDPMGNTIGEDLNEHIDGIRSHIKRFLPEKEVHEDY